MTAVENSGLFGLLHNDQVLEILENTTLKSSLQLSQTCMRIHGLVEKIIPEEIVSKRNVLRQLEIDKKELMTLLNLQNGVTYSVSSFSEYEKDLDYRDTKVQEWIKNIEYVKQLKKRDSKPLNQITEIEPLIWNLGIWRKNKNPMNTVIQAMREQRFGGI